MTSRLAHAGSILATDFTGVVTTGWPTATNITWVTNGVTLSNPGLTFTGRKTSDGSEYSPAFFANKGTPENNIQVNANIETVGPWSTSFSLTPTSLITLANFTLGYRAISGSGVDQSPARSAIYTLAITQGASSLGSFSDSVFDAGGGTSAGDTADIDLSTLTLSAGLTYVFTLTVSSTGTLGNNVAIDDLALNGTFAAVPEPESTAIAVAIGALALGFSRVRRTLRK